MRSAANILMACCAGLMMGASAGAVCAQGLVAGTPYSAPAGIDPRLTALLGEHAGRPLVINFWASWCEPCRDEMPALARLPGRLPASGVALLTVAVADREADAAKFMRSAGLSLPVLHDRDQRISRAWGARLLPYTVVLDRRHRVVAHAQGVIDWDDDAVLSQLRRLFD